MSNSKSVLLVEDHDDTRKVLALILVRAGYAVIQAATMAQGMALLDGQAVALLDLNLPDGLGTDILDRIRAEALPIRVAILSASSREQLDAIAARGADAVFAKPLDMAPLLKWVRENAG